MTDPILTIVIACYNHGAYLPEAIESTQAVPELPRELIIVDDGSTDPLTLLTLQELQAKGFTVLRQENQGPAAARNLGISQAKGCYILPLDADNRLHPNYLSKAIVVLDTRPEIDIVYGDFESFGAKTGLERVGEFSIREQAQYNNIDTCAVYRREVWEAVGGYDTRMPVMGHEDWAFWLHAWLLGKQFYYLREPGFYYRWLPDSVSSGHTPDLVHQTRDYLYQKHYPQLFTKVLEELEQLETDARYRKAHPLKAAVKTLLGLPFVRPEADNKN